MVALPGVLGGAVWSSNSAAIGPFYVPDRAGAVGAVTSEEELARSHRRLGESLHAVEIRLKRVAAELADPGRARARADELSARGERHLRLAEAIDPSSDGDDSWA